LAAECGYAIWLKKSVGEQGDTQRMIRNAWQMEWSTKLSLLCRG
jgi:hypothetical protein